MDSVFFFNDTATTEIYTLSLHDALPILRKAPEWMRAESQPELAAAVCGVGAEAAAGLGREEFCARRSEEHTSELQSRQYLVCRLLLEKKKKKDYHIAV